MGGVSSGDLARVKADIARQEAETAKKLEEQVKYYEGLIKKLEETLKTKDELLAHLKTRYDQLIETPTPLDCQRAMQKLQYQNGYFHIAVAGNAGVGKSSLLNSIRGLCAEDAGAAREGDVETTLSVTKYPSPKAGEKVVYYDVPGAGTQTISRWDYFKAQGLYIMNALIVVQGNRVTDTDIAIIKNCARLTVPVFVARSKCDDTLRNIEDNVQESHIGSEASVRREIASRVAEFKRKSIEETANQIKAAYKDTGRPLPCEDVDKLVFLVNKRSLLRWVKFGRRDGYTIDEPELIKRIVTIIAEYHASCV